MDQSESAKEWYATHAGEKFGPVSFDDLKQKVGRGELNPRHDTVWKQGMEGWISAGEVEGLFKKNIVPEAVGKAKESKPVSKFEPDDSEEQYIPDHDKWEGTSRGGFIFFFYLFPVIWLMVLFFASGFLAEQFEPGILKLVIAGLCLFPLLVALTSMLKRFQNLGMSRAWFFGLPVPLLNCWLGYRLFACPEGYAERKKLGGIGWVLAIIYWSPLLVAGCFGVFVAVKGTDSLPEISENHRAKFEVMMESTQKFREIFEELAAKEEQKEKVPTMTRY